MPEPSTWYVAVIGNNKLLSQVSSDKLLQLFVNAVRAGYTLVLVSVSTPVFIVLILPLAGLYLYIQRYYLRTSRELKRLDSITKSPIYAHFQESLGGITTIRAYRQESRFALENEWRVDANLRAYFPSINANRWLAVRLEFIGSVIIFAAAIFAIIAVSAGGGPSAGLVGLAMSYALQITSSLNWIVRQTVEVETVSHISEIFKLCADVTEHCIRGTVSGVRQAPFGGS